MKDTLLKATKQKVNALQFSGNALFGTKKYDKHMIEEHEVVEVSDEEGEGRRSQESTFGAALEAEVRGEEEALSQERTLFVVEDEDELIDQERRAVEATGLADIGVAARITGEADTDQQSSGTETDVPGLMPARKYSRATGIADPIIEGSRTQRSINRGAIPTSSGEWAPSQGVPLE